MIEIAANDLKTAGVGAIAAALEDDTDAVISVRGRRSYVVMGIERYQQFREAELDAALAEARADVKAGRVQKGGIAGHLRRVAAK
jgi:PHD/YefM family antitoxin component YafN of YafNO toxin-antitoxin module